MTTQLIMYRDISDDDILAQDTCEFISEDHLATEHKLTQLQCAASENCYYYVVEVNE